MFWLFVAWDMWRNAGLGFWPGYRNPCAENELTEDGGAANTSRLKPIEAKLRALTRANGHAKANGNGSDLQKCEQCGCDELHACEGGCAWDPSLKKKGRWVCTTPACVKGAKKNATGGRAVQTSALSGAEASA